MKKFLFLLFAAMMVLAACGETEEKPKEISKVEKESDNTSSNESEVEEKESDYDQVLIDSETVKVTLESISKIEDKMFDEEYHLVKMSIENKSDKTIIIQTDEVSIDGLMVTDNVFFSEEVAGGKKANGKMQIQLFDEELPPLDEELEMILLVIDGESYDRIDEEKINIEIK